MVGGGLGLFSWADHHKFRSIHSELVSEQQEFKNIFSAIIYQLKLWGLHKAD